MSVTHERKLFEETPTNGIRKILLIDKKKPSGLSAALTQEGYNVIHCDSVQNAWSLIYPYRPHLIIIHLDGLTTKTDLDDLQECRALAGGVPMVLATSAQVNETLRKVLRHRAPTILNFPSISKSIRETLHDLEVSR